MTQAENDLVCALADVLGDPGDRQQVARRLAPRFEELHLREQAARAEAKGCSGLIESIAHYLQVEPGESILEAADARLRELAWLRELVGTKLWLDGLLRSIAAGSVEVRAKQRSYFRERTSTNLDAARAAERALDVLLTQYVSEAAKTDPGIAQLHLFGERAKEEVKA